ncbi:MAG: hypothetical protein INQ03_18800 [Candidatus Heimdallarchaeota archaeon]|nr:hypothetical protein [Candidatus Heimdallarchaeota archaeon]
MIDLGVIDSTPEKIDRIFMYFDSIPNIQIVKYEDFKKAIQGIRKYIIHLLTVGLDDKHPISGNSMVRKVFNAIEIKNGIEQLIEKEEGKKTVVKKSNLYFHLKTLEEMGLIVAVEVLNKSGGKGKNYITYYGKCAKMYVMGDYKAKKELMILENPKFKAFLQDINPVSRQNVDSILDKLKVINENPTDQIISWMEKYYSLISKHGLSHAEIFNLIHFLKIQDSEIHEGIGQFRNLIQI